MSGEPAESCPYPHGAEWGSTGRRSVRAAPKNRKNAANFREGEKTRRIFPILLFSGVLWKSTIKNAKKYNSFRRFVEYLPVLDTLLRPFPTIVGFGRRRAWGVIGCGGDGAQHVRQVVVAATERGALGRAPLWWGRATRRGREDGRNERGRAGL